MREFAAVQLCCRTPTKSDFMLRSIPNLIYSKVPEELISETNCVAMATWSGPWHCKVKSDKLQNLGARYPWFMPLVRCISLTLLIKLNGGSRKDSIASSPIGLVEQLLGRYARQDSRINTPLSFSKNRYWMSKRAYETKPISFIQAKVCGLEWILSRGDICLLA